MQDAVEHRREQEPRDDKEDAPRVQRIDPREQFAASRARRVYGTHASQQHGRVEKGCPQPQSFKVLIAEDATDQGDPDDTGGDRQMPETRLEPTSGLSELRPRTG